MRKRLLEDLAREEERAAHEQEKAEEIQWVARHLRRWRRGLGWARRLQEERDRLLAEAPEEARVLREEREAERTKGFWRRLLGGS
jgi:hypothetical protein